MAIVLRVATRILHAALLRLFFFFTFGPFEKKKTAKIRRIAVSFIILLFFPLSTPPLSRGAIIRSASKLLNDIDCSSFFCPRESHALYENGIYIYIYVGLVA